MAAGGVELPTELEVTGKRAALEKALGKDTKMDILAKGWSSSNIGDGFAVRADWLKRLCCFIDAGSNDDPGEISNYPISNNIIIEDIQVLQEVVYGRVKEELGCTADVQYRVQNAHYKKIKILTETQGEGDIPKYIYVCLCTESEVQRKGSSFSYGNETYIFVSVSRKVRELMNEFHLKSEKDVCIAVQYLVTFECGKHIIPKWKTMEKGDDLEVLLTRGEPQQYGSMRLNLVFH